MADETGATGEAAEAPPEIIEVRGQPVILDSELARLFGTTTMALNQQVKRNRDRFEGFGFQLTAEEFADLKSQICDFKSRRAADAAMGVLRAWRGDGGDGAAVGPGDGGGAADRQRLRRRAADDDRGGKGQNLPARLDARDLLPIGTERRNGLVEKIDRALGRVLDAIVDPVAETTVREEARTLVSEGLGAIKAQLAAKGIENERTLAEIHKLLREAEAIEVEIEAKRTETEHRRLRLRRQAAPDRARGAALHGVGAGGGAPLRAQGPGRLERREGDHALLQQETAVGAAVGGADHAEGLLRGLVEGEAFEGLHGDGAALGGVDHRLHPGEDGDLARRGRPRPPCA